MQTNTDKLIATKDNGIGWITFNNPARHNAVSLEMWQALTSTLEAYAVDPEVRVIILKGAGDKAFVAGADISQFKEKRSSPEAVEEYNSTADRAGQTLQHEPEADDRDGARLLHRRRHRARGRLRHPHRGRRCDVSEFPRPSLAWATGLPASSGSPTSWVRPLQRRSSSPPASSTRRKRCR